MTLDEKTLSRIYIKDVLLFPKLAWDVDKKQFFWGLPEASFCFYYLPSDHIPSWQTKLSENMVLGAVAYMFINIYIYTYVYSI